MGEVLEIDDWSFWSGLIPCWCYWCYYRDIETYALLWHRTFGLLNPLGGIILQLQSSLFNFITCHAKKQKCSINESKTRSDDQLQSPNLFVLIHFNYTFNSTFITIFPYPEITQALQSLTIHFIPKIHIQSPPPAFAGVHTHTHTITSIGIWRNSLQFVMGVNLNFHANMIFNIQYNCIQEDIQGFLVVTIS